MKKTTKRLLSAALAVGMTVSVGVLAASCGDKGKSGDKSYTYKTSTVSLGTNWNPHTWETNADRSILSYQLQQNASSEAKWGQNLANDGDIYPVIGSKYQVYADNSLDRKSVV